MRKLLAKLVPARATFWTWVVILFAIACLAVDENLLGAIFVATGIVIVALRNDRM